jgi:hypothetical protein
VLIGFKAIAAGASHLETGKPCQDAVDLYLPSPQTSGCIFAADGHGSEKYTRSETGSKIAVETAREAFTKFLLEISNNSFKDFLKNIVQGPQRIDEQKMDKALNDLEKNIIYRWREKVLKHLEYNELTEQEHRVCQADNNPSSGTSQNNEETRRSPDFLYGTTLIAAAIVFNKFWFALQIGDGACIVIPCDSEPAIAIPEDERLAFGRTTSLCNSEAIEHFRHCFKQEKIAGITVATDGVVDSFTPEKYLGFNAELRNKFIHFQKESETELQNFLPELSERGSRDDVAIAGLFIVEEK